MYKRSICILLSLLFILNFGSLDLFTETVAEESPITFGGPLSADKYIVGDWIVDNVQTYQNGIIDLRGNLTIENGGLLTFRGITLRMNVTAQNQDYKITIKNGGQFNIHDIDGNPKTVIDRSVITDSPFDSDTGYYSYDDYRTRFVVEGKLDVKNSILEEICPHWSYDYGIRAMVSTAEIHMDNSTLRNAFDGIYAWDANNVEIKNSRFLNIYDEAIFAYNVYGVKIYGNKIDNVSNTGVYAQYCDDSYYLNNTISNAYNGINLYYGDNVHVENNSIETVAYGLYLYAYRKHYEIRNNYINGASQRGIYAYRLYETVMENNIINNTAYGIYTYYSERLTIRSNTITNISQYGIHIRVDTECRYERNTIMTTSSYAIYCYGDSRIKYRNLVFENNTIKDAAHGFYARYYYEITMKENTIEGAYKYSGYGLYFYFTYDNRLEYNDIKTFNYGIWFNYASNNFEDVFEIYEGSISDIGNYAIYLYQNTYLHLYNVTLDLDDMYIYTPGYNNYISVYFNVDAFVVDSVGPVGGAEVTVSEKSGAGLLPVTGYTDETGWARSISVLNRTKNYYKTEYYSPYNFSADISGSIGYADKEYDIGSYRKVKISYDFDTFPAPPVNLHIVVDYDDIVLQWESYVTDLDSYKIYRNNTVGGWEEFAHIISPPPGVNKVWVDEGNASNLMEFRYKIHHIDYSMQEELNDNWVLFNDWVITDYREISNRAVMLNGSLIVEYGGHLNLRNTSVLMNGTDQSPGIKFIEVRNGGTLVVEDTDDNKTTTHDNPLINASKAMGEYEFIVEKGGHLELSNTRIQDARTKTDGGGGATGGSTNIYINSDNCTIRNSTIISENYGILLFESESIEIKGNTFYNTSEFLWEILTISESNNIKVSNNNFINASSNSIRILNSESIEITYNDFEIESGEKMFFSVGVSNYNTKDVRLENNTFRNFAIPVDMSFNEDCTVKYNKIYNSTFGGIYSRESTNLKVYNNMIEYNNTMGQGDGGISVSDATDLDVRYNIIYGMQLPEGRGIYIGSFYSMNLIGNLILDADYGIYINNYYTHSQQNAMIGWNTVRDLNTNWGIGFYIYDTDNLGFFNNTIYNVNIAIQQQYSENILHYGNEIWNVTYGYFLRYGSSAVLINCTVQGLPPYAVYLNQSSEIDLLNPNFNLSKMYISDKTCQARLYWQISVSIKDHYGLYHSNVFLRVRSILGTILTESYTDNSGYVNNIVVMERIQFYNENLSYMPASFEAEYLNHTASVDVTVDRIMVVDLQLGNTAPDVYNIFLSPIRPTTTDDIVLNLGYTFVDNENDNENRSYYKWYRREDSPNATYQEVPALDNMTFVPASYTKKGELWYCRVVPCDDLDFGTHGNSQTVRIFNTKPEVSEVRLFPANPDGLEDLYAEYSFFDIDGDDDLGTVFHWYVETGSGPVLRATTSLPVLNASFTNKGEVFYVMVEPKDGEDPGTAVASNNITIGNTYPWVVNVEVTPPEPSTSDDLTVSYDFIDIDLDPEGNTTYYWLKDYGLGFLEAGFYSNRVPAKFLTKGEVWKCRVTPFDGELYGKSVYSTAVKIGNTAPAISELKITIDSPSTMDDLSVSYVFNDRDSDPENGTQYEWLKKQDGVFVKTGLKIKTLPSLFTTKGETWVCEVTPSDGYAFGPTVRSSPVTIQNSAPVASDLGIAPMNPRTVDPLTISYDFSDDDNDAESGSELKWYRNGVHMPDFDNKLILSPNATARGESWYFTISPGDGTHNGVVYRSASITIRNSKPVVSKPYITPSSPVSKDDLTVNYQLNDPDGDKAESVRVRWYMNGEVQAQYQNKLTIPSNATQKGQSWKCVLSVFDGTEFSDEIESASISIKNSPPRITDYSPVETSITISETGSVVFSIDVEDLDGDLLVIQWFEENKIVGSDYSYVFSTDYTSAGNYSISVTLQDWGAGSVLVSRDWSIRVLNQNRQPELHIVEPLNPRPVFKDNSDLRFVVTYNDPDVEDTPVIEWYIDDTLVVTGESSYTFSPSKADIGLHKVEVKVSDGDLQAKYSWNATVKESREIQNEFMGLTWDQWSIILEALVVGVTGLVAFFGFLRYRRRKGALQHYMKDIEDIMKNWKENPDEAEDRLVKLFDTIETDFGAGKIEDFHYFLLDRQIKENLREIRQTKIQTGFTGLPEHLKREMNVMLEDGRITEKEYRTFVTAVSESEGVSERDKIELRKLMRGWKDVDAAEGKKKVIIKPVSVMRMKKRKIESKQLDWQDMSNGEAQKDAVMEDDEVWDLPDSGEEVKEGSDMPDDDAEDDEEVWQ